MLQDLLGRIAEGGLNITVVPVEMSTETNDPDGKKTIDLLDDLQFCEQMVRALHKTMKGHGYEDKAQELKSWYTTKTEPTTKMMNELTKTEPVDREEFLRLIREFNDAFEPIIHDVREKLKGITARHLTAICEVDISDLLV